MKNILFAFLVLFTAFPVAAHEVIMINEFLIDPQPQQVELINSGSTSADLGGWIIDDNGGSISQFIIPEGTIIQPEACLVFSRDFNLNKSSSDSVRLIDPEMSVMDSYTYKSSSGSGVSYFRLPDGASHWATGSATIGLFNETMLSCVMTPPTPTLPIPLPTQSPTPYLPTTTPIPPVSYMNIYLSEVLIDPGVNNDEWVEIYNGNDFPVVLSDWYIDDIESGGSAPKKFSTEISGKSYRVVIFPTSIFNNSNDTVRLLDFEKNEKDSFEYSGSTQGVSYGKSSFPDGDFCLQTPSFETQNNPCLKAEPAIISSSQPTATQSVKKTNILITESTRNRVPQKIGGFTSMHVTDSPGEVLGVSNKLPRNDFRGIRHLVMVSLSYSLLTLASVLFKMTCIYGKGVKLSASFFRSP